MAGRFGRDEENRPVGDLPSFMEFTSSLRTTADYLDNIRRMSSSTVQSEGYHQLPPQRLYPECHSPPKQLYFYASDKRHDQNHQLYIYTSEKRPDQNQLFALDSQTSHVSLETNPFLSGKTQFPPSSPYPGHHLAESPMCVPGSNSDTALYSDARDLCKHQLNQRASLSRPPANDWTVGGDVAHEYWTKELCSLFDAMPLETETNPQHTQNVKNEDFIDTSSYSSNIGYQDTMHNCPRGCLDVSSSPSTEPATTGLYFNSHYIHANSVRSRDVQSTSSADASCTWYDYKPPLMTSDFSLDSDMESCSVTSTTDHFEDPLLRFPVLPNEKASFDHVSSSTSESGAESDVPSARLDNDDEDVKQNFILLKEARRAADEPRRPKNSFIRFSVENRRRISMEHPLMDNREISKVLGSLWKTLTPEQKKPYEIEFSKDMETIRTENPDWQYIPTNRLAADLVEPMPRRLRPRNCLKKKMYIAPNVYYKRRRPKQVRTTRGKQHTSSSKTTSDRFTRVKRMVQKRKRSAATAQNEARDPVEQQTWVQCDVCYKWRRLPTPILPCQLPDIWLCELNPDRQHRSCFTPEELFTDHKVLN